MTSPEGVPTILSPSLKTFPISVLLVDDQVIVAAAIRKMLEDQPDITFHYCSDPTKALTIAADVSPTVILQDLVMPDIDGLRLVRYFRANPATRDIPMIVLSTKEEPKIKAEAFALGANDYVVKLPDKVELIARIRYHSESYVRLLERNQAYEKLEENQRILDAELKEAAGYVTSLLPEPLNDSIKTSWRFIPSTQLGGDAFGYHWLDSDNFALYLLDVCGHGVGAALLSISIVNVLRSQTLPNTNFHDPEKVLESLNETFQMEKHNNMFFTIWYGVFNKKKRQIVFSCGGHPPAILFTGDTLEKSVCQELKTPGLVIGAMPGVIFKRATCDIGNYNKFYLFSDGIYEITKKDGSILQMNEFITILEKPPVKDIDDVERIVRDVRHIGRSESFPDDVSILQVIF